MRRLADVLRSKRAEILAPWPSRDAGPRGGVPRVFDQLIEVLEQSADLPVECVAAPVTIALRELSLLREAIVHASASAVDVETRELVLVHAVLDGCMARTAATEAELRERFVGILSHDLRSPLSNIKLAASLLRSAPESARTDLVERITRAVDRMTLLIGDLLDFAKLRGGSIVLDRARCDLRRVCEEVVRDLDTGYPGRMHLDVRGDVEGEWDARRLTQVVTNLVGNALTYSPAGTAVDVGLEGEGAYVAMHVHNGGAPIAEEMQREIFEPFKRGSHARGGGVGLGLFIASEMVRAHGGSIELDSRPEVGTTFTVRLPRRT